jgi:mannosyltransferase
MATSERERKGTIPLLEAWERVVPQLGDSPRLHLVLDAAAMSAAQVAIAERRFTSSTILVHERMDYAPYSMSAALGACHVVCQPSRSEGFGLTPLEARACGVPVIATACTGHSEHLAAGMPGVVIVEHGALAPIDDLPGASAPSVTSDAVATALLTAHAQWEALDCAAAEAAEQIRSEWAWPAKLSQWLGQLRS